MLEFYKAQKIFKTVQRLVMFGVFIKRASFKKIKQTLKIQTSFKK